MRLPCSPQKLITDDKDRDRSDLLDRLSKLNPKDLASTIDGLNLAISLKESAIFKVYFIEIAKSSNIIISNSPLMINNYSSYNY